MRSSDSCILAVDAGGTSLKAALVSKNSFSKELEVSSFFSVPVNSGGSREEILNAYRIAGARGAGMAAAAGLSVERVAVCIPGPFDYSQGRSLMRHKYQEVYQVPLGPCLADGTGGGCPVTFLHDSSAFLLGALLDAPEKKDRACGVTIGTGLGFACVIGGRIQENSAGGPAVSIYSRPYLDGTCEDYVSKRGILGRYLRLSQSGSSASSPPSVAQIASMAREGDLAAARAFADTGFHLGQILLPVLKEYRLDTVLLGGAISKSADLFLPSLRQVLAEPGILVLAAARIDHAPLLGAAMYAVHT